MDAEEVVQQMVEFMKNVNELLKKQQLEINNLKIDIEKIKKHQKNRILEVL